MANKYWFPRKRYGWGWGLPNNWKGWVTFITYFAAIGILCAEATSISLITFYVILLGLTFLLMGICYWKGEPPKWSWGDKSDSHSDN